MSESEQRRSVVVIGGGPGGYVAAIRAAQLGASVTLVEKKHLGGTCLNVGCIPTKALLHAAEAAKSARDAAGCGIHVDLKAVDWGAVLAFKDSIVRKLVGGVAGLLRSNGVSVINGTASLIKPKTVRIESADGSAQILEADRVILATGSVPVIPPIEGLRDSPYMVDSTGLLCMETLPPSMAIIGGGVIGVELAFALNALGCRITIIEALPRLVPTLDGEIAAQLAKSLRKQGISLLMEHRVVRVENGGQSARIVMEHAGAEETLETPKLLCAVGRRPRADGLNLDAVGIHTEKNRILTDQYQETNVSGVYAIGDCVGQVMLAHTASAQGETAAENAMGGRVAYRPNCVPSGVYGFPEAAGVGLTEEEAQSRGIPYHAGRFPLAANGRALIANDGEGMVKVLIGDELNEILGVHILAPSAMEMIGEAAAAISMEGTAEDLISAIHAHPTATEAIREAVLAAEHRAIHVAGKPERR